MKGNPDARWDALSTPTTSPHPSRGCRRAAQAPAVRRGEGLTVLGQGSGPLPAEGEVAAGPPLVRRGESCKAALFARRRPSSLRGMHKAPGASASGHPFFGNKMCAMPALLPAPAPAPALFYL